MYYKGKKIVWRINLKRKRNIVHLVFFILFAVTAVALLIQALITALAGKWSSNNAFLIFWPICCVIFDVLIFRAMVLTSQPEDEKES